MVNYKNNTTIERKASLSNRSLAIILSILVAIIVFLTFCIIFANRTNDDTALETVESDYPLEPADLAEEINTRYENDGEYPIKNALNDYKKEFDSLEGDDKVEFAELYAKFCYKYNDDLKAAMDILDSVSNLVSGENEISYYFTYIDIYENSGDTKNAAKYQNILAEKYPEMVDTYDVTKQEEMEYENPTE